jgi:hypothetical protein
VGTVLCYKSEGRGFDLPDSLQHRITDCGEGPIIWNWTLAKLGLILHMDPQHIQRTWPLRPDFHYWPPQRQTALIWILAHLVYCRTYPDSPPPFPSRLHGFPQTGSLESTFQEGTDPEHRQLSGTALTISHTEPTG